jgi:hypothetical protein
VRSTTAMSFSMPLPAPRRSERQGTATANRKDENERSDDEDGHSTASTSELVDEGRRRAHQEYNRGEAPRSPLTLGCTE